MNLEYFGGAFLKCPLFCKGVRSYTFTPRKTETAMIKRVTPMMNSTYKSMQGANRQVHKILTKENQFITVLRKIDSSSILPRPFKRQENGDMLKLHEALKMPSDQLTKIRAGRI